MAPDRLVLASDRRSLAFGHQHWRVIGEFPDNMTAATAALAVARWRLSDVETMVAITAARGCHNL